MGGAAAAIGGGLLGGAAGGLLGKKEGGSQTANILEGPEVDSAMLRNVIGQRIGQAGQAQMLGGKDIQNYFNTSPYNTLFGQGGTMGKTAEEEQRLATQGFQLTPEDREAYGQVSGDIARQFGQQEQNLAQSLAARGLDSSGVATQQFAGLQGNKAEQLAGLQRQIANDRMQNTLQRLGQTRQFLSQLGQEQNQAVGQVSEMQNEASRQRQQAAETAMNYLQAGQGQRNTNFAQSQSSAQPSQFGQMVGGALGGAAAGGQLYGALSGAGGLGGRTLAQGGTSNSMGAYFGQTPSSVTTDASGRTTHISYQK